LGPLVTPITDGLIRGVRGKGTPRGKRHAKKKPIRDHPVSPTRAELLERSLPRGKGKVLTRGEVERQREENIGTSKWDASGNRAMQISVGERKGKGLRSRKGASSKKKTTTTSARLIKIQQK